MGKRNTLFPVFPNFQVGWEPCKGRRTFLAAVDELSGVHSLGRHERLLSHLVPVRVSEDNPSERGAATRVMDDVLQSTHLSLGMVVPTVQHSL